MSDDKRIRVRLTRSVAGRHPKHKACVRGLGLRRIGHAVELPATPAIRGMIRKVAYLLQVEEL